MKRCTIAISDAGPITSLWVADRLDLLAALDMPIVLVDALYDELTGNGSCQKHIEIRDFIDRNSSLFSIASTDIGQTERGKRLNGTASKNNASKLAIVDFFSSEYGLQRYLRTSEPVVILFEDASLKVFNRPPNLHLISTVGMLQGLERCGVLASAEELIEEMRHPTRPGRRQRDARGFSDQPLGLNHAASFDFSWMC